MDRKNFLGIAALAPLATLIGSANARDGLVPERRASGILIVEGGRPTEVLIDPIAATESPFPAVAKGVTRVTVERGDETVTRFGGGIVAVDADRAPKLPPPYQPNFPIPCFDVIIIRIVGREITIEDLHPRRSA